MPTPADMMKDLPQPEPVRPGGVTLMAIQAFREAARAEDLLERKNDALMKAVARIPESERNFYVEATEEIRREYEAKQMARPSYRAKRWALKRKTRG